LIDKLITGMVPGGGGGAGGAQAKKPEDAQK